LDLKNFIGELEQLKAMEEANQAKPEQLKQLGINELGLHEAAVDLKLEEVEALGQYLKALQLIVDCKDAAVSLSSEAWEKIENEFLKER
jgi:hypothetical protein